MPVVTRVKKEPAADRAHMHIVGVCTADGGYYTRAQVVAGLDRGESWTTYGGGMSARIKKILYCPRAGCYVSPYITTAPDYSTANNLDNLPPC
jgi:hypothetical protein